MPRPPRVESAETLYHVTVRGVQKSAIVRDDHDRIRWLEYLKAAVNRAGLELYAFTLMDNHFHLFLSTPKANLGEAMQYLNGSYAAYFNARHERKGHLFDNRYHAVLVESQGHYLEVSRYVHLNPVRAGIVKRLEDYPWSSYHGYHFGRMPLSWLNYEHVLSQFSVGTPDTIIKGVRPLWLSKEARERYRVFVAEGIGRKLAPPWARALGGWILGTPKFAAKIYAGLANSDEGGRWDSRAVQGGRAFDASLDEISHAVCAEFHLAPDQLKSSHANSRDARRAFAFIAREHAGYSLKSIGVSLQMSALPNISALVSRAKTRAGKDKQFARRINDLISRLAKKR